MAGPLPATSMPGSGQVANAIIFLFPEVVTWRMRPVAFARRLIVFQ